MGGIEENRTPWNFRGLKTNDVQSINIEGGEDVTSCQRPTTCSTCRRLVSLCLIGAEILRRVCLIVICNDLGKIPLPVTVLGIRKKESEKDGKV